MTPGTPVVIEPFIGCGKCYPCRAGKSNCCAKLRIIGVHFPGGFGELVVAPAEKINRIPSGVSFAEAAFAEPVEIGVQAGRRRGVTMGEYPLLLRSGRM